MKKEELLIHININKKSLTNRVDIGICLSHCLVFSGLFYEISYNIITEKGNYILIYALMNFC